MRSAGALLARRCSRLVAGAASPMPSLLDAASTACPASLASRAWPATGMLPPTAWRGLVGSPSFSAAAANDGGDGSHDDFKPQSRGGGDGGGGASGVDHIIKADLAAHRVFVYMKGEPEAPQCGFSNMVCRILDAYGVDYGSRNVLADPAIREGIKAYTGWPTIPQVFARTGGPDGEPTFLGGADILMAMHNAGELGAALGGGGGGGEAGAEGGGHVHGPGCGHNH